MQALKGQIKKVLMDSGRSQSPEAETDQILFHVLRKTDSSIRNYSDLKNTKRPISESERLAAIDLARLRATGRPLQHILGFQFFYEHDYEVNESTLIPRPETEVLVQSAMDWVKQHKPLGDFRFAELGIGSGIISGELLSHFPKSRGAASDHSLGAIILTHRNLSRIIGKTYRDRLHLIQTPGARDGFEVFKSTAPFDLILSNPPYVSKKDEISEEVLTHEPGSALFPSPLGSIEEPDYFYDNFLTQVASILRPGGASFFEVPHERADEILIKFKAGGAKQAELISDLTGRPRVLRASF